jgi:16S rRNA (cytosine1402-N4)-methyltransferase
MRDAEHAPVLVDEALRALAIDPRGTYVDATFGRGGHTLRILDAIGRGGRVIALDRDPAAFSSARAIADPRFTFRHAWFSTLPQVLAELGVAGLSGVLLDLGVSSPQIDDATRGFSYRFEGPLDMRMDTTRGDTGAEFVARASVAELTRVLRDYGEERFAQSIARAIEKARAVRPIGTTRELAKVVAQAVGTRTRGDWRQDPAARTFQALRIVVNRELDEVSIALPRIVPLLRERGRLCVISFHSLEDRIVKRFFAFASKPYGGDPRLARIPLADDALPGAPLAVVGRAAKPSSDEQAANPRSRSAVLRVAERTPHALPADWPRGWPEALG